VRRSDALLLGVGYWPIALFLSVFFSSVPCPPETDCETAAWHLIWHNIQFAAVLYACLVAAFLVSVYLKKNRN